MQWIALIGWKSVSCLPVPRGPSSLFSTNVIVIARQVAANILI